MLGQSSLPQWLGELLVAYDQVLSELFWFVVGFGGVYLVGQLVVIPLAARVVQARNRNNPTIASATKTYLRVALLAFATLTGVIVAGYGNLLSQSAVVIAAITFVFGIAGQQVFGSLISGLFLVADPDFNVGDWIEWPNGQGTVEAVHFRVTRIRTPNNGTLAVPNTELTNGVLTRPYGRDRYRITEQVFVAYDEDTEHALLELRQTAEETDGVLGGDATATAVPGGGAATADGLDEPAPTVRVLELGENAITLQAEFWIDDPMDRDIVTIRSDFRRQVKRRFDEEGLTLAPPSAQSLEGELTVREQPSAETNDG